MKKTYTSARYPTRIHLPGWHGFVVIGDRIWTPAGEDVHRNQVEQFWYVVSLATAGKHLSDPSYVEALYSRLRAA
jgi:hypothetical protein